MKKSCLLILLALLGFLSFGDEREEVDFLLFAANSSSQFVNQEQAMIQLDTLAKYLMSRNLTPGQISVYGYAANGASNFDLTVLSKNRALFVINELQKRGVPGNLFSDPVGYGDVNLWGNNTDEDARKLNRRVRILLDGNVLTPDTMNIIEPEEKPLPIAPIATPENVPEKSKFPWGILLPLLLLALLLLFLLTKRKKPTQESSAGRAEASESSPPDEKTKTILTAAPSKVPSYSIVNIEEEIRIRAYEFSQQRSGWGDEEGDWYAALPEVCDRYEAAGYQVYTEAGSWWARKANN